jgi:hypothetical protein
MPCPSDTKEYRSRYRRLHYLGYRAGNKNTCKLCIDWWSCKRSERRTKLGCEAKLTKEELSLT